MKTETMIQILNDVQKGDLNFDVAMDILKDDLRKNESRKNNGSKRTSILNKLFANCKRNQNERLVGHYKIDERFLFTDGYRLYLLNNDFGTKPTTDGIKNPSRLIPSDVPRHNVIEIDMADLKSHIAIHNLTPAKKPERSQYYEINTKEFSIYVNPHYLLEMLQMLDTEFVYLGNGNKMPLHFRNDNGEYGMLLPYLK